MKRTTPKPRISILRPEFVYRDSASTDIRKTFARIKREMAQKPVAKVTTLARKERA